MEGKIVGFTGTRKGLSIEQGIAVNNLLENNIELNEAHHGDAIGADKDFHQIADRNGLLTHGHPPLIRNKRAFCCFDRIEPEKEYLERDRDIVDAVDWLIACPQGYEEELRSGTWATIRWAIKVGKPGIIVWPDGKESDINEDYPS